MCNSGVSIVNFQRIDRYAFHFVQWSQSLNPIMFVLYMLLLLQLYSVIVGFTFKISHAQGSWHEVILPFIICFNVLRDIDLQKKCKGCKHFLPVFLMRVTHGKCFSLPSMQVNRVQRWEMFVFEARKLHFVQGIQVQLTTHYYLCCIVSCTCSVLRMLTRIVCISCQTFLTDWTGVIAIRQGLNMCWRRCVKIP
jgi:hypothetical protein